MNDTNKNPYDPTEWIGEFGKPDGSPVTVETDNDPLGNRTAILLFLLYAILLVTLGVSIAFVAAIATTVYRMLLP